MSAVLVRESPDTLARALDRHRPELTSYCGRRLGSASEAEDAVQETLVRAWRTYDRFEGRAALRTWLYRIAGNVCIDMRRARQRAAPPVDTAAADHVTRAEAAGLPGAAAGTPGDTDPGDAVVTRDALHRAFVVALGRLPARQRAVLVLCEVLRWPAADAAALLGTTPASVTSALQRARATLAATHAAGAPTPARPARAADPALVTRHVEALASADLDALLTLLR